MPFHIADSHGIHFDPIAPVTASHGRTEGYQWQNKMIHHGNVHTVHKSITEREQAALLGGLA